MAPTLPDDRDQPRWYTIPNVLGAVRFIGSWGFVPLAVADQPAAVLALFLFLTATDWIDGKLAIWLQQRSSLGARLDSVADATMYGLLLAAGVIAKGNLLVGEWPWLAAALLTFAASQLAALAKFRRMASYHTRTAKFTWLAGVVGVAALFLDWPLWPLRWATAGAALANLESIGITVVLPVWRADVISIVAALRIRRQIIVSPPP